MRMAGGSVNDIRSLSAIVALREAGWPFPIIASYAEIARESLIRRYNNVMKSVQHGTLTLERIKVIDYKEWKEQNKGLLPISERYLQTMLEITADTKIGQYNLNMILLTLYGIGYSLRDIAHSADLSAESVRSRIIEQRDDVLAQEVELEEAVFRYAHRFMSAKFDASRVLKLGSG